MHILKYNPKWKCFLEKFPENTKKIYNVLGKS